MKSKSRRKTSTANRKQQHGISHGEQPNNATESRHPRYVLIFLTGAVILSVEVLASRIMTPYFGVSLYIWASILSTTLAFLALGYYCGGRLTQHLSRESVNYYFFGAPLVSAAALIVACLLYPILFSAFLDLDLVVGSFLGSILLLAVPLVALSAMNPMLVALLAMDNAKGDRGAGRIFFISTIGSVVGVLFTAFALIPYITNYRALLLLSLFLSVVTLLIAFYSTDLPVFRKKRLSLITTGVVLSGVALLALQRQYLEIISADRNAPATFDVKAEYTSLFGNIKVVEIRPRYATGPPVLAYLQDGLVQNRALLDGRSVSMYTYVLEELASSFAPSAERALVLGLGAGIVAMSLQRNGSDVTVVDINSRSLTAAQSYFRFEPSGIDMHWRDARTYVRQCGTDFDIVIVDLFHGDGTPDYLLTQEFFEDLKRCLSVRGAVIMNAFFDTAEERSNNRFLATVASVFSNTYVFRTGFGAGFIVGSRHVQKIPRTAAPSTIPEFVRQTVVDTLASGRPIESRLLNEYAPITDSHNVASIIFASAQMRLRRALARQFPALVLVN